MPNFLEKITNYFYELQTSERDTSNCSQIANKFQKNFKLQTNLGGAHPSQLIPSLPYPHRHPHPPFPFVNPSRPAHSFVNPSAARRRGGPADASDSGARRRRRGYFATATGGASVGVGASSASAAGLLRGCVRGGARGRRRIGSRSASSGICASDRWGVRSKGP